MLVTQTAGNSHVYYEVHVAEIQYVLTTHLSRSRFTCTEENQTGHIKLTYFMLCSFEALKPIAVLSPTSA